MHINSMHFLFISVEEIELKLKRKPHKTHRSWENVSSTFHAVFHFHVGLTRFPQPFKRRSLVRRKLSPRRFSFAVTSGEHFHVSHLQLRFRYLRSPRRIEIHRHAPDWIFRPRKGIRRRRDPFWIVRKRKFVRDLLTKKSRVTWIVWRAWRLCKRLQRFWNGSKFLKVYRVKRRPL